MIRSEIAANLDVEHSGQHGIVTDVRMAVEREMRGVERDVSFYQSSEPAITGTHHRPLPPPKHSVMNEETVGVLLGGKSDRGLAQVHSGGEAGDVTCVDDLQAIQRLTRRHGLNLAGARYVIQCLRLLDAAGVPRPSDLDDVDIEHVNL